MVDPRRRVGHRRGRMMAAGDDPIEILVKPHGSIAIRVPVVVRDPEGNEIPRPKGKQAGVTKFCGCGRSANKPFCDGSHKQEPTG